MSEQGKRGERVFLDSADSPEQAWLIANGYIARMQKHGVKGRMVSVRRVTRHMYYVELTKRPPIPEQRKGGD